MTRSELVNLLREANSALGDALFGDSMKAAPTLDRLGNALRALDAETADGVCASCGSALTQPATGRPRVYCGSACKKRAQRARQATR